MNSEGNKENYRTIQQTINKNKNVAHCSNLLSLEDIRILKKMEEIYINYIIGFFSEQTIDFFKNFVQLNLE